MSTDPRARRRTAFHEAGHAVVGWAYRVEGVRVTSDFSGEADITFPGPIPDVEQIAICKAGWVGAERSGVENLNDAETLKDEFDAIVITRRAFPDDEDAQERLYQEGWNRAQAIVLQHAAQVTALACELERRGDPSADEVARLLKEPATPAA